MDTQEKIESRAIRVLNNAKIIVRETPDNGDWDDTEAWVTEAAELAHDISVVIEHFQNGGSIPDIWIGKSGG